jgi:hypothetical protein
MNEFSQFSYPPSTPRSIKQQPVIATGLSEDTKQSIVRQLETECHVRSVATDLAIEAGAEQHEAALPEESKSSPDSLATKRQIGSHPHESGTTLSTLNLEHRMR